MATKNDSRRTGTAKRNTGVKQYGSNKKDDTNWFQNLIGFFGGGRESGRGAGMRAGDPVANLVSDNLQRQQGRPQQRTSSSVIRNSAPRNPYGPGWRPNPVRSMPKTTGRNPYGPGYRPDPSPGYARANRPSSQDEGLLSGMGSGYGYNPPGVPDINYEDLLNEARGLVGDMGLSQALGLYQNQEADLRQRAQESDARIAAMYDQLRKSILNESGEAISSAGDTAQERLAEANTQQTQGIQQAYDTAQDSQNEILNRLGIGDANAVIINKGNQPAQQMQADMARATTQGAAEREYSAATNRNADAANTTNANAVGQEGVGRRADLQGQLGSLLAELADRRSQAQIEFGNASQQAALSLANQLYGQEMDRYNNQYNQWGDVQGLMRQDDATAFDQAMAMQGIEQQRQQMLNEIQQQNTPAAPKPPKPTSSQLFDQQIQAQFPEQSSAISQALAKGGGNLNRLIEELGKVGISGPNAQAIASQFLRAYGYQ